MFFALPLNEASRGIISYSVDATNINMTYPIAPASGGGNLSYVWGAGYIGGAVPSLTPSSATTFTQKTIGDFLTFDKVSVPANQADPEDTIIYNAEIDANNNGLFSKIQKNGVIFEVPIA